MYENARAIQDFRKRWEEVEIVLDSHTRFDVNARSYVETHSRIPIACEHVGHCISAARSKTPSAILTQMLTEYGNYDETG